MNRFCLHIFLFPTAQAMSVEHMTTFDDDQLLIFLNAIRADDTLHIVHAALHGNEALIIHFGIIYICAKA